MNRGGEETLERKRGSLHAKRSNGTRGGGHEQKMGNGKNGAQQIGGREHCYFCALSLKGEGASKDIGVGVGVGVLTM